MSSKKQPAVTKTLESFCLNDSTLQTKIALMTFYQRRYNDWTEKIILLLEYLQLISQSLMFYASNEGASTNNEFSNTVLYFFKLVNPSFLMPLNVHSSLSSVILFIVLSCMIIKYIVFLYIAHIAYRNYEGREFILTLWRWIFKIQSRILCFFMTSFWSAVIIGCSQDTFHIEGMNKAVIIVISSLLILIEYLFSFYLEIHFNSALPTRNFLAAKSCSTQTLTLLQKLTLQILHIIFWDYSRAGVWIFSVFNMVFSLIKIYQCYDKLILYSVKALLWQNRLHSIVISLNLACFVETIRDRPQDHKADMNFVIILWLLLALLLVRFSNELLVKRIFNMVNMKLSQDHSSLLVHKVLAIQELRRYLKLPTINTNKFHLSYLFSMMESVGREQIFGLETKFYSDQNQYQNDESIFVEYLTRLSTKFPTNELIKLHLAHACLNDPNQYLKSLKATAELTKNKWSQMSLSASLLIYETGKTLATRSQSTLDLLKYIKSQIFMLKLETCVKEQVDLKIKICKNILGEIANIGEIFNCAQKIDKCKEQTRKKIKFMYRDIPDYYIEPFLLVAGYYLTLEYSREDFQKYIDNYTQKKIKYENDFESLTLTKENMYQNKNIFLMLSGQKTDCGQILFCSDSIQSVCGGQVESYKGMHISSLFTPSFQAYYLSIFRQLFETGEEILSNKIHRAFLYHKDDYIVEVEFYLKIHPYLAQGCYLSMIIRSTNSPYEYLLIKEDGNIEGATKRTVHDLHLNKSSQASPIPINIKAVSEELGMVNQAFNMIAKAQDSSKIFEKDNVLASTEYKEALKIYNAYTSELKRVQLTSMKKLSRNKNQEEQSSYDCNVQLLPCGSISMKIIELAKLDAYGIIEGYIDRSIDYSQQREEINGGYLENVEKHKKYNISLPRSEDIDCEEIVQTDRVITEWKGNTEFNTIGDLIPSTSRKLLTERSEYKNEHKNVVSLVIPTYPTYHHISTMNNLNPALRRSNVQINESQLDFLTSTQAPNNTNSKTITTTFRNAIGFNFRTRSFRAICMMFYAVILITLLSQFLLKIVSDNTMDALSVKKTLLSLSQLRTFKMLLIENNCAGTLNTIKYPDVDFGVNLLGVVDVITNIQGHQVDLKNYNQQILDDLYLLNNDVQRDIFLKNTYVTGSYENSESPEYRYVTTFEIVNEVIDAIQMLGAFKLVKTADELLASTQVYNLFNFIKLNIMNDYLTKSQEITNIFVDSVHKERDYFQSTITVCLIVTPLLLIGIVFMLIIIIFNQYNIEKKHMLAFIRLKPKSVRNILNRLRSFKANIVDRDPIKLKLWLESVGDSIMKVQAEEHQESNYHRKHASQVINKSDTRNRYLGYVVRVVFYILILIAVMLYNFFSAQDSTKVIYRRQSQLEFANHLSETISVIYCSINELFGSNDTTPIKNGSGLNVVIEGIKEVTNLQAQLTDAFLEEDRTYDPTIEAMMFHYDRCEQYNFATFHNYLCNLLLSSGAKITLIPVVLKMGSMFQDKLSDFYNCENSTLLELLKCGYRNIDLWLPTFILSTIEAQKIGDVVAKNLEDSIFDAYYQRNVFLIAFSISLGIVSILIWMQILRKLRDVQNDFKKVLQVFPPHLVLSSFLFKNFLLKHSKTMQN